ncbi:hypothetical protein SAMN06265349_10627 [Flavobacterium resistens]|uniref:Squalene cyclase C-terminal domain-containing protein n=1 Tax=Flavobacterium resistens TaxID=443612 RepID=A0A521EZM1_9FLAO|nr:hypothetical protein [Flavobacterium resistens]MRX69334.1 hypothetical protein [Flavobacterium resistens]SMO89313.1 hypothetical protein SAMN06265349_10627 [Flavobacterium resistens]
MKFHNYIQQLNISNDLKKLILDEGFMNKNPHYYQNYPSLFATAFSISEKELNMLDIAGYLYYQATLFTDSLIDEKDLSKFSLITVCQEESIKILTSIYGIENDFWKFWNTRKDEYLQAVYLEKELSKKEMVKIEQYEILADKKAAFGKIAIDSLFSFNQKDASLYQKLLLSHKYFSVAFQINDDIQDFKEDLKKGQFNWAIYSLQKQNVPNNDPEILEKYLYVRGISKKMYQLGIEYCEKALEIVLTIDVPKWKQILLDTKRTFATAIIEIDTYLEILTSEINLSNKKNSSISLKDSIHSAIVFLKSKQQENGTWREYVNQGGISNIWSTAFILSKISENSSLKLLFKDEITKALQFLNNNPSKTLWGYNTTWIEDSDSTNFVFLSYFLNNKTIDNQLLSRWKSFQKTEGAFSTYSKSSNLITTLNDKHITDVTGWISNHNCVSAVSFYFLANQDLESQEYHKIKAYFDINLKDRIKAYWWTNDIYTYYYLAKTYHLIKETEKLDFIIDQVKMKQNANGSFSDNYGENFFYTGLAVEILLLRSDNSLDLVIEKSISFLLKNQFVDGSWENSNALQIPDAKDINPINSKFPVANYGINVRAKEFNRLFTTSSILKSLSIYGTESNSKTF